MGLCNMAQFHQSSDNEKHITFEISTTISTFYQLHSVEKLVDFPYLCFLRYKVGTKGTAHGVSERNKQGQYFQHVPRCLTYLNPGSLWPEFDHEISCLRTKTALLIELAHQVPLWFHSPDGEL